MDRLKIAVGAARALSSRSGLDLSLGCGALLCCVMGLHDREYMRDEYRSRSRAPGISRFQRFKFWIWRLFNRRQG